MQAVMAFAQRKAGSAATSAAAKSAGPSGSQLGGASRGVSVLGSIMEFAGARQKAAATDQEARDEAMAGRQEFVTATERVNAIDADYNRLVNDQLAAASVMGIDLSSGSVIAARDQARDEADRERKIIRNSAETNAAQRRLRSIMLRNSAKNQRFGSVLNLGVNVASAFMGG